MAGRYRCALQSPKERVPAYPQTPAPARQGQLARSDTSQAHRLEMS